MKRAIIYFGIFSFLTTILLSCSREMEQTYPVEDTLIKSLSFTPNEYYEAELEINNESSLVEVPLGDSFTASVELSKKRSDSGDPRNHEKLDFYITPRGDTDENHWQRFDETYDTIGNKRERNIYALHPGEWDMHVVVSYHDTSENGAQTVYSNVVQLNVPYPKVDEFIQEPGIAAEMHNAWNETISQANALGVIEIAFLIYAVTESDGSLYYEIGTVEEGDRLPCKNAKVTFFWDENNYYAYQFEGDKYIVAWFHTHPPMNKGNCTGCRSYNTIR